ncbi:MAG: cell division protein SepF [Micromonosporaceae bacterium]
MGAMRKAGVWLGLIEDEDDRRYADDDRRYSDRGYGDRGYGDRYDDTDYDDELAEEEEPILTRSRGDRGTVRSLGRPASGPMTQDNLALAPQVQLRERAVVADDDHQAYRITTLHPTTYNEARTIGEHFRESVPVIMNLSEMDESDAKRLVDFAAGLAFGLRGTIERVTNRVFLLSPANVQVTAEDKAKIAEGGFFNQS